MEVRGQLVGVRSLLPPGRSQGLRVQALMLGSRLLYPEPSLAPEPGTVAHTSNSALGR